jgi:hypothetical protein
MRPNRAFQFEDGKLVVEADVAAGIAAYGEQSNAWTEMVITNAPEPTGKILTELYTYGQFGGYWSFGCRLAHDGTITCALYNPHGTPGNPQYNGTDDGRVFEMSWFQHVGSHIYNGQFDPVAKDPLRKCQNTDPDTNCRDRFRLELTKSSVTIYVNGIKYFEQSDLPAEVQFPDAMINNDVYVYFSGWQVRQDATPIRFHWDRLAVNPKDAHGKLLPPSAIQEGHSAHHEP